MPARVLEALNLTPAMRKLGVVMVPVIPAVEGWRIRNSRSSLAIYKVPGHPGVHEILPREEERKKMEPLFWLVMLWFWDGTLSLSSGKTHSLILHSLST